MGQALRRVLPETSDGLDPILLRAAVEDDEEDDGSEEDVGIVPFFWPGVGGDDENVRQLEQVYFDWCFAAY